MAKNQKETDQISLGFILIVTAFALSGLFAVFVAGGSEKSEKEDKKNKELIAPMQSGLKY